jgi:hypothetical protein
LIPIFKSNAEFNKFIGDIERDIESGIGQHALITVKNLFSAKERFYNNLVSKKEWTSVDSKDARLLALATEIEQLNRATSKDRANHHRRPRDPTTLPCSMAFNSGGPNFVGRRSPMMARHGIGALTTSILLAITKDCILRQSQ